VLLGRWAAAWAGWPARSGRRTASTLSAPPGCVCVRAAGAARRPRRRAPLSARLCGRVLAMREGGPVAEPGPGVAEEPNCAGLAPETEADPAQFANLLGLLPETERDPRRFARPPGKVLRETRALRQGARERAPQAPGSSPSLPKRDQKRERRAAPGAADPEQPDGAADAKPSAGGADAKPSAGAADAKPSAGGADAKPSPGGADAKPSAGGADAKPSAGGADAELSGGGADAEPAAPRLPPAAPHPPPRVSPPPPPPPRPHPQRPARKASASRNCCPLGVPTPVTSS
jgi:hypothetical protein